MRRSLTAIGLALAVGLAAPSAAAFCGFYVAGADAKLVNNATMVVLMREGMRTVLSMQNNYEGPPADFAMVVPVPIVLQKENVKTLSRDVFEHIDALAAPRLVEYWERDPCAPPDPPSCSAAPAETAYAAPAHSGGGHDLGVKIEAKFAVGEYEILILSAQDSTGLDTWLRGNGYKIPAGAEATLRPYVAAGMKFFVAKVDVKKVAFDKGQAMLSPLRFHYDSDTFSLPVRLGLLNSGGTQDLIVHVLAKRKRYEVANYKNVTIPTNYDVADETRQRFGAFYAALFDATLEKNPGAVVTEYAWDASNCDPCPVPPMVPEDLVTLGADAILSDQELSNLSSVGFTLTRLHARYGKAALGDDLVFRETTPIAGGREEWNVKEQAHGAHSLGYNNFQARYVIRHPWQGRVMCLEPKRGVWGGPPAGTAYEPPKAANNIAFAPRGGVDLASIVRGGVGELGIAPRPGSAANPASAPAAGSCACGLVADETGTRALAALAGALAIAAGAVLRRRRR